jgi:hypothetical protein
MNRPALAGLALLAASVVVGVSLLRDRLSLTAEQWERLLADLGELAALEDERLRQRVDANKPDAVVIEEGQAFDEFLLEDLHRRADYLSDAQWHEWTRLDAMAPGPTYFVHLVEGFQVLEPVESVAAVDAAR